MGSKLKRTSRRKVSLRRTRPGPKPSLRARKSRPAHHRVVIQPTAEGGIFASGEAPKNNHPAPHKRRRTNNQNRGIMVAAALLAVLGGVLFVTRDRQNPLAVQAAVNDVRQNGCSAGTENLEKAFGMTEETALRAEIAALISQCASAGFKDLPKAVKYAKEAGGLYAKIGDQQAAQKYTDYAERFDQLLNNPQPPKTSDEDRGTL